MRYDARKVEVRCAMRLQRWAIGCLAIFGVLLLGALPARAQGPRILVLATRTDASGAVVIAPAITDRRGDVQSPIALPGQYVIINGENFPPNQPIKATLVAPSQTYVLAPQNLGTSVTQSPQDPTTDSGGAFQNVAFALPAAGLHDASARVRIAVGGQNADAPVAFDFGTVASQGDKISVVFALCFYAVIALVFIILLRGLPRYPVRRTT